MTRSNFRVLALSACILVACTGGSDIVTPPPPPPTAPTATLSADHYTITIGQSTTLVASCSANATSSTRLWPGVSDIVTPTSVGDTKYGYVCANSVGSDTAWVTIHADTPPPPTLAATLSASNPTGFAPLATNLTGTATGTADGPLLCTFHFGDATRDTTISTSQNSCTIPHTFVSGSYPASVYMQRDGLTATSSPMTILAQTVPPVGTRSLIDRPDSMPSDTVAKLVYFLPSDGLDRGLDTNGTIAKSAASFLIWFAGQTRWTFRMDTYGGQPDILFFKSTLTNAQILALGGNNVAIGELQAELAKAGFCLSGKRCLVYYDGGSSSSPLCGQATGLNGIGALYLQATNGNAQLLDCRVPFVTSLTAPPGYWEMVGAHELGHTAGAVDVNAPDYDHGLCSNSSSHINKPNDLMYGCNGWSPQYVDQSGDNYFGDLVPAGVINIKNDPVMMPAPASMMAQARIQAQASLRVGPPPVFPALGNDLVIRRR